VSIGSIIGVISSYLHRNVSATVEPLVKFIILGTIS